MILWSCACFVKCYSILHFRFDELLLSKGKTSLQSDDAVVNQMDIHQLASLLNLAGQCQVSLGGRGPTQRMIMCNDNRGRLLANGITQQLINGNITCIDGAIKQFFKGNFS